jgi:DNA-directed RNA polymerase subunit RPC12/RpoP
LQGNTPIPGATKPELKLTLSCNTYGERSYRCIRCKMVSRKVPYNAYHIKCGNCSTLFAYKDVSPDCYTDCYSLIIHTVFVRCVVRNRWKSMTSASPP